MPHILAAAGELGRDFALDGEICATTDDGRTDLSWLSDPASHSARIVFHAFDLLSLDRLPLNERPLLQRKELLSDLLPRREVDRLRLVDFVHGSGHDLLEKTRREGHEGVVAKRSNAAYQIGVRSDCWLKFKNRRTGTFRVAGWQVTASGALSSLLLATDDDLVRYCGRVGTGFTSCERTSLPAILPRTRTCALPTPPPRAVRTATWCDLTPTAEIEYLELSSTGILREPSFKTLALER